MRICEDCGRPVGEDMEKPVEGHCYGSWFPDWRSTDCWRIASAMYKSPRPAQDSDGGGSDGEGDGGKER